MSVLVVDNVRLSFGERVILPGVNLRISETDRIGLVGPNGSGKTTLLSVISGAAEVDSGGVQRARHVRVGHLPQELEIDSEDSLSEFVTSAVPGRDGLEEALADAEAELQQLGDDPDNAEQVMEVAQRIADIHDRIDHFERYYSEHQALQILAGLGFSSEDKGRSIAEFSGGWQMRAALGSLLFQQPELLLLDEPTNHLDMPSVAWFSGFLQRYRRAFVLISHDREFLNEQISRVISFEPEGVRQYDGNHDQYLRQREEEQQILENKARNLARERERMQRFVDRFRAQANKAKAVQSRVKALEKFEDVEVYQSRRRLRFSFAPCERAAAEVIRLERVSKRFGDRAVLDDLSIQVRRGDKIGIIGVNGAGKTTLLRMMAGELPVSAGDIVLGGKAKLGYYAQHHADALNRDLSVYDSVAQVNPNAPPARVRSVLGAFLFSGDDVDKPVSVLSGGERARVALARLLIDPGNVLLMDEPTNHLDLDSSDALAQSLAAYDGTLVFVSHNRSFIRTLATKIWNVADGSVETYPGTLDEYIYSCQERTEGESPPIAVDTSAPAPVKRSRAEDKEAKRRQAELRNRRYRELKPLREKVERLESRITKLESQQAERSELLSDPKVYEDAKQRNELLSSFQKAADKIEELTARWESATEELESVEATLEEAEA